MDLDPDDVVKLHDSIVKPVHNKDHIPPVAPEKEPNTILVVTAIALVVLLAIVVVMVKSAAHAPPKENNSIVIYNQFEFVKLSDGFWQFNWSNNGNVYAIPLRYNPTQVENITITGSFNPHFGAANELYVALDPSNDTNQQYVGLGAAELSLSLIKVFGVKLIASCTNNETEACAARPIRNCNNTDDSVIIVREGDVPSVTLNNMCITVQGRQLDLVRAVDRLLYQFYNVMN